jgi:hypothetical protein
MPRKSEILSVVSADKKSTPIIAVKEVPKTKIRHTGKKTTVSVGRKLENSKPKRLVIHSKITKPKRASTHDVPLITKKKGSSVVLSPSLRVRKNLSLALLSPFRFPIDHAQLVSQVARYAGTAFIMVGAFLTLYNINAVNSYFQAAEVSQVAQTASSSDCAPGSISCTTTSSGTGSSGTGGVSPAVNTTPTADFNVESNGSTLLGTVPVNLTVPLASTVTVAARSSDSNQTYTLGTFIRVSDLVWRNYWQTANFLDGSYRLKAVITNQYGTYTVEDQNVYTVLNHPIEQVPPSTDDTTTTTGTTPVSTTTATTTANSTSTTSLSTTPTTVSTTEMRVDIGSNTTLTGTISARTFVYGATSVRLFTRLRDASGALFTPIGYASFHGDNEWRFAWDTTKISNGAYDLKVQAVLQDGSSAVRSLITNIDNKASDTTVVATTTVTTTLAPAPTLQPLEPEVVIEIAKESPISGDVEIYINAPSASYIELYSVQTNMLTPRFLGLANKQNDSMWRYRLNSPQMPNGSYELFAKVRHVYGESISSRVKFSVKNPLLTEKTVEETVYVETLVKVSEEIAPQPDLPEEQTSVITSLGFGEEDALVHDEIRNILESFNVRAQNLISEYARAVRLGDTEARDAARARMDALEDEIITKLPQGDERTEVIERVREYLSSMNTELREKAERNETFIKERVGDAIVKDTDKDGISDYDEVSIYKTDPLVADTDSDGYVDGAEILSGYNPTDDKPEANIQFESPKDAGVVREDLLTVTSIGGLLPDAGQGESQSTGAMIAGTGLPSSFVTLYIFSTPIIVTVKTDTQGNWSYIFDKELDDGNHEVYVGITDNAGKIVAKSNPLAFVKTAEAFSPIDAEASAVLNTQPENPSLVSGDMMLVVGSIAVVALGLVLILLGLHVKPREGGLVQA